MGLARIRTVKGSHNPISLLIAYLISFVMRTSQETLTVAGSLLALARVRLNLTQRDLAARSGCAQSTIARIELGRVDPGFESVLRILASVGLEPRIHLETLDDHDMLLLERHSGRTDAERRRVEERHKANISGFKNARVIEKSKEPQTRSRSDH
jgi:transcriptional regulator with XRE-family HTH domain